MKVLPYQIFCVLLSLLCACSKKATEEVKPTPIPSSFSLNTLRVNGDFNGFDYKDVTTKPEIILTFNTALDASSLASAILLKNTAGNSFAVQTSLIQNDSAIVIKPALDLDYLNKYTLSINNLLKSKAGGNLRTEFTVNLTTQLDTKDKFPRISDEELLTKVQQQTFRYFWDFGHPVSGLARERNTSGDIVTSGGSGFGIMAMVVGIERRFITREQGLQRLTTIVDFLTNQAEKFHGAFPHWLNGATGKTVPFSAKDNGADLVETSFLMQGLLTARQYFDGNTQEEITLRQKINTLWNGVEWNWFTQNTSNGLYWHWSPTDAWAMNMKISGWNEALITYVLAASSEKYAISKDVYQNGWTRNGAFKNGNSFFGVKLPLGINMGGPLFFTHYSFLGLNPKLLTDQYTNYFDQNKAHAQINYLYCKANPKQYAFYGENCWGLTASDNENGYSAHAPDNDLGVISPTAALSSFPYTPTESMQALQFFYYKLGDKIWKEYGFVDAFNLNKFWYADSFLAIDQGPIIVMIENHRSGLLWNLLMSCPEVKNGLKKLELSN
ncbi:glucoamylase family protein [Flectobacillus sp. BAB-3569]|uniref:glucoamylase family protein n=1 Tax=Flectobacillus sp. BAB-3569 TaxID=1509483 RepID=UPI000BA2FB3F|nr:glucoamylase family protein [Flectobacillus sp. BAB-3569]PAC29203.1 beta-glucosidase [Flectobacillus sp. BAB-3569]